MPLVDLKTLLTRAEEGNYAVGAFNVSNMEMILGAVNAACDMNSPIILQVAQGRLPYSPLAVIGPMMVAAARNASVPVCVNFDHGKDISLISQALELGFTAVMIDASRLPLEENIAKVREVKALADRYGAAVEAEVGQLGTTEEGVCGEMFYSDPAEVKKLYESTGVDAVALSIGNAHGLYKREPRLKFELLSETARLVKVPLVLHGGSGISEEDFRRCIRLGIRKINIATANFMAVEAGAREYAREEGHDYFKLSAAMADGMYGSAARHIKIFGSDGKA